AGTLHLLRAGSLLEIRGDDGKKLGRAVVRRLEPVTSVAEWVGDPPEVKEPVAVRAIEIGRPRGAAPLRLRIDRDAEVEKIAQTLATGTVPPVELLRGVSSGPGLVLRRGAAGAIELVTVPEALQLWTGAVERAVGEKSELTLRLAEELRHRDLLALAEQPGTIPVEVEIAEATGNGDLEPARIESGNPRGAARVCGPTRAVVPSAKSEALLRLNVRVDATKRRAPVYVSILCASED